MSEQMTTALQSVVLEMDRVEAGPALDPLNVDPNLIYAVKRSRGCLKVPRKEKEVLEIQFRPESQSNQWQT